MKHLQSQLNTLEAWAQEELAGQRRILALITRQEEALVANRSSLLLEACQELEQELRGQAERADRRSKLFGAIAESLQVDARALSLSSILERVGAHPRLANLRDELRRSTAQIVRRNRRFAALAAAQRKLIEELVTTLLQQENPKALHEGGTLVNAKA